MGWWKGDHGTPGVYRPIPTEQFNGVWRTPVAEAVLLPACRHAEQIARSGHVWVAYVNGTSVGCCDNKRGAYRIQQRARVVRDVGT